jgi:hypothetical protein
MTAVGESGSNSSTFALGCPHVPGVLDHRELHAQADAEEGHLVLARVADRLDLALDAALAEAAGHEHRVAASSAARVAVAARASESMYSSSTRQSLASPPCTRASWSDL